MITQERSSLKLVEQGGRYQELRASARRIVRIVLGSQLS